MKRHTDGRAKLTTKYLISACRRRRRKISASGRTSGATLISRQPRRRLHTSWKVFLDGARRRELHPFPSSGETVFGETFAVLCSLLTVSVFTRGGFRLISTNIVVGFRTGSDTFHSAEPLPVMGQAGCFRLEDFSHSFKRQLPLFFVFVGQPLLDREDRVRSVGGLWIGLGAGMWGWRGNSRRITLGVFFCCM